MRYKITRLHVLALSAAALIILGIIASGWIRNAALPWYVNQTTGRQVVEAFDRSFGDINEQLNSSGVHFKQEKTPPCYTAHYHYLRLSIHCAEARAIYNGDNNVPIPTALMSNWQAILRDLAVGEQQEAWHVNKNSTNVADAASLFKFAGTSRNTVGFIRNVGAIRCTLVIVADPPQGIYKSDYQISEVCQKDVRIFGGWDCAIDYCKQ